MGVSYILDGKIFSPFPSFGPKKRAARWKTAHNSWRCPLSWPFQEKTDSRSALGNRPSLCMLTPQGSPFLATGWLSPWLFLTWCRNHQTSQHVGRLWGERVTKRTREQAEQRTECFTNRGKHEREEWYQAHKWKQVLYFLRIQRTAEKPKKKKRRRLMKAEIWRKDKNSTESSRDRAQELNWTKRTWEGKEDIFKN